MSLQGLLPTSLTPNFLRPTERETGLLLHRAAGIRSLRVTHYLTWAGYPNAVSLEGGTEAWTQAGLPMEGASEEARAVTGRERYQHGGAKQE